MSLSPWEAPVHGVALQSNPDRVTLRALPSLKLASKTHETWSFRPLPGAQCPLPALCSLLHSSPSLRCCT